MSYDDTIGEPLEKVRKDLQLMPTQVLMNYKTNKSPGPEGLPMDLLAGMELSRRAQLQQAMAAKSAPNPQQMPTVVDAAAQQIQHPQGMPPGQVPPGVPQAPPGQIPPGMPQGAPQGQMPPGMQQQVHSAPQGIQALLPQHEQRMEQGPQPQVQGMAGGGMIAFASGGASPTPNTALEDQGVASAPTSADLTGWQALSDADRAAFMSQYAPSMTNLGVAAPSSHAGMTHTKSGSLQGFTPGGPNDPAYQSNTGGGGSGYETSGAYTPKSALDALSPSALKPQVPGAASSAATSAATPAATDPNAPPVFDPHGTYGTPQKLLDNLHQYESSSGKAKGYPYVVNPDSQAVGPYQFLPSTVDYLNKKGVVFDPFDPVQSRSAADYYMHELIQKHGGNVAGAIADWGGFKKTDPSGAQKQLLSGLSNDDLSAIPTAHVPRFTPPAAAVNQVDNVQNSVPAGGVNVAAESPSPAAATTASPAAAGPATVASAGKNYLTGANEWGQPGQFTPQDIYNLGTQKSPAQQNAENYINGDYKTTIDAAVADSKKYAPGTPEATEYFDHIQSQLTAANKPLFDQMQARLDQDRQRIAQRYARSPIEGVLSGLATGLSHDPHDLVGNSTVGFLGKAAGTAQQYYDSARDAEIAANNKIDDTNTTLNIANIQANRGAFQDAAEMLKMAETSAYQSGQLQIGAAEHKLAGLDALSKTDIMQRDMGIRGAAMVQSRELAAMQRETAANSAETRNYISLLKTYYGLQGNTKDLTGLEAYIAPHFDAGTDPAKLAQDSMFQESLRAVNPTAADAYLEGLKKGLLKPGTDHWDDFMQNVAAAKEYAFHKQKSQTSTPGNAGIPMPQPPASLMYPQLGMQGGYPMNQGIASIPPGT